MTSNDNIHRKFYGIYGPEYKKRDLFSVCATLCRTIALPDIGKNPIETVRKNWGAVCNHLVKEFGHTPSFTLPEVKKKPKKKKGILSPEQKKIMEGKICPYCKQKTEYIDSIEVYGVSYGMIYICRKDDAYVGVHKDSPKKALGRLANKELRDWKVKAHAAFDPLWKSNYMNRHEAYAWLAKQLNIPREYCHIGMMGVESCKALVTICKKELA